MKPVKAIADGGRRAEKRRNSEEVREIPAEGRLLVHSNDRIDTLIQFAAGPVGEKPEWRRPVTTILEIDEVTLNGGDGSHECDFSHS
jgi:hypothetical protein